jgi:hypothetical protein
LTNPAFELHRLDEKEEVDDAGIRTTVDFEVVMHCPESDDREFADAYVGRIVARSGRAEAGSDIVFDVDPPIEIDPKRVFLQADERATNNVVIVLQSDSEFSISKPESGFGFVEVSADYGTRSRRHRVAFQLSSAPSRDRPRRTVVELETDHRAQPVVRIPVYILWHRDASP